MKVSEQWLREWVNPPLTREKLCERLTMAGLEIESALPVAEKFSHVVIGEVLAIEKHPDADRLNVCTVNVGSKEPLQIVCAAKNVAVGIRVPAALSGAVLPNNLAIKTSELRGVTSHGMLCSSQDLGLAEKSEGLYILPKDAKIGESIWEYLNLEDHVLDINITPNRGDCLSLLGLSKDISALTETKVTPPDMKPVKQKIADTIPITLESPEDCPHYVGRVIRNVQADATTPIWLQERLRRSGIRCISPVVDIMNYVMLELGQPMHAFDLAKIQHKIIIRKAKPAETLVMLDGETAKLTTDNLIIADQEKPLALAGVMGGLDSGVTLLTKDIFLESAYFTPECIAKTKRYFKLNSESSYRYERGVDPTLQNLAIERATQLLLEIVGGEPGPVIDVTDQKYLPKPITLTLRKDRVAKILGMQIPDKTIESTLKHLELNCKTTSTGWEVNVPLRRSDITIEVDLIEEIMRINGSDKVPAHNFKTPLQTHSDPENKLSANMFRHTLCDLGYHEVVTYSFIDPKMQKLLDPHITPVPLLNAMSADMEVMRTNLWPGLLKTLQYNQNRQQSRVRLFEIGLRFIPNQKECTQKRVISGLIWGDAVPEQWGTSQREVDFFDLKGDLENLFHLTRKAETFIFKPAQHPALHPGQSVDIHHNGNIIGQIGLLHPNIKQELDITGKVYLFELQLDALEMSKIPRYDEISKFPEIRRDLALIVDHSVPAQALQDTIRDVAGELLTGLFVFDVYQGKGITPGRKSIAIALALQHASRTLVDEEVAELMERVIVSMKEKYAAELRG